MAKEYRVKELLFYLLNTLESNYDFNLPDNFHNTKRFSRKRNIAVVCRSKDLLFYLLNTLESKDYFDLTGLYNDTIKLDREWNDAAEAIIILKRLSNTPRIFTTLYIICYEDGLYAFALNKGICQMAEHNQELNTNDDTFSCPSCLHIEFCNRFYGIPIVILKNGQTSKNLQMIKRAFNSWID